MRALLIALFMLMPMVAWGQAPRGIPPLYEADELPTCNADREGWRLRANATSASSCSVAGSTVHICQCLSSTWTDADSTDVTVGTAGIIFSENGESLLNSADSTFDFTIDENGTALLTCSDTSGECNITISAGGAGVTRVGDTGDVAVVLSADTDVQIQNGQSGNVTLDLRDYADTTDDDMAHAIITVNCTTTTSGAEDCDLTIGTVEDGVAAETRFNIDGDGDVIFPPERINGGNGNGLLVNPQRRINGIPKIVGFALGVGNDGSETVATAIDETPAGEWTATSNLTDATETTVIRMGTGALALDYTGTVVAGNGADNPLGGGDESWAADESVGMWHRCNFTYSAGDLVLGITDNASEDTTTGFPAYGTADTWVWIELEIGSIGDTDKDVITDIALDLSTAGAITVNAASSPICYFDYFFKWDAAEELALGIDIYEDGILSMYSVITASANITPKLEVEGTDYFVHYETGNDFIVPITDLSADSLWGMAALE